jgi:hypothetical protein
MVVGSLGRWVVGSLRIQRSFVTRWLDCALAYPGWKYLNTVISYALMPAYHHALMHGCLDTIFAHVKRRCFITSVKKKIRGVCCDRGCDRDRYG